MQVSYITRSLTPSFLVLLIALSAYTNTFNRYRLYDYIMFHSSCEIKDFLEAHLRSSMWCSYSIRNKPKMPGIQFLCFFEATTRQRSPEIQPMHSLHTQQPPCHTSSNHTNVWTPKPLTRQFLPGISNTFAHETSQYTPRFPSPIKYYFYVSKMTYQ